MDNYPLTWWEVEYFPGSPNAGSWAADKWAELRTTGGDQHAWPGITRFDTKEKALEVAETMLPNVLRNDGRHKFVRRVRIVEYTTTREVLETHTVPTFSDNTQFTAPVIGEP